MNEQRPYEQTDPHFGQLPDIDGAWTDMKARLDKEEKRRRFLLPPFLTGCGGWALLLLLLAGGGLWWYLSSDKENEIVSKEQEKTMATKGTETKEQIEKRSMHTNVDPQKKESPAAPAEKESKGKTSILTTATNPTPAIRSQQKKNREQINTAGKNLQVRTNATGAAQKGSKGKTNLLPKTENELEPEPQPVKKDVAFTPADKSAVTKDSVTLYTDTTGVHKGADSVAAPQPTPKKESKRFIVAAGLSLQQQLPVAGQQWTPYNYRGRRGSLGDYVPAVDLRLYKEGKWFLQAGFRYGAPQYTREFVYSKNFKTDTFGVVQSSTAYRLKKTYYHQVPVSFNYFVKPQWSIGAGVVYNKFFGAVSEREDREQVTPTTDSLIGKAIVRDRNDSLFRSSNWQLLLETQYQWKRFSLGARFTQGLQPFIEYTDAQGRTQKQKNSSVNLFIRYELWRQKK